MKWVNKFKGRFGDYRDLDLPDTPVAPPPHTMDDLHPDGRYTVAVKVRGKEPETKYGVMDYKIYGSLLELNLSHRTSLYYTFANMDWFSISIDGEVVANG